VLRLRFPISLAEYSYFNFYGPQASPNRTRAINALAAAVTELRLKYPGSSRVIAFEPAPLR
jgi:hypothetical protein